MKQLAGSLSTAIRKAHLENVVVMDFFELHSNHYSLLGRKLADDLQAALAADNQTNLVDRKALIDFQSREALFIPEAVEPEPAEWMARQVSAKAFVVGIFDENPTELALDVTIYESPKSKRVANIKTTLAETDELRALNKRVLVATGEDPHEALEKQSRLPKAGTHGYGIPGCEYCPQPAFSDEATHRKASGTVTLLVVVGADGKATDIQLIRGAFFGLGEKAAEAIQGWRFKPATDAKGNPVDVYQAVEMTFRLY